MKSVEMSPSNRNPPPHRPPHPPRHPQLGHNTQRKWLFGAQPLGLSANAAGLNPAYVAAIESAEPVDLNTHQLAQALDILHANLLDPTQWAIVKVPGGEA